MSWLYVMSNPSLRGFKIGYTRLNDVKTRADELFRGSSGVPHPFKIEAEYFVRNPDMLEQRVHRMLDRYRIHAGREFFDCDRDTIGRAITKAAHDLGLSISLENSKPLLTEAEHRAVIEQAKAEREQQRIRAEAEARARRELEEREERERREREAREVARRKEAWETTKREWTPVLMFVGAFVGAGALYGATGPLGLQAGEGGATVGGFLGLIFGGWAVLAAKKLNEFNTRRPNNQEARRQQGAELRHEAGAKLGRAFRSRRGKTWL